MFKTDKVYIDSQIEALKLRVEWLENELKFQANQIRELKTKDRDQKPIRHTACNPVS